MARPPGVLLVILLLLVNRADPTRATFVLCPYCDPNYTAYPNLEASRTNTYGLPLSGRLEPHMAG